jgi:hypothetical protein
MSGMFGKAMRFAKSKQGKEAIAKAKKFASSPEGKERIADVKGRLSGHKEPVPKAPETPAGQPAPEAPRGGIDTSTDPKPDPNAPA